MTPFSIDYPKSLVHYRGGAYAIRRICCHPVDAPEFRRETLLSTVTLQSILEFESAAPVDSVASLAKGLSQRVSFYLPDHLFELPMLTILDELRITYPDTMFTRIS